MMQLMFPALLPLRFEPILRPMLWGGNRLSEFFKGAPTAEPIGEAWLLSDEGVQLSKVADGPFQGRTLRELLQHFGPRLLGQSLPAQARFPLLLKIIHAERALSIQVHPNDEQAACRHANGQGKTEGWVVLHAEPGAKVYAGLKPGVDCGLLEQAVRENRVAEMLHVIEPQAGDAFFLPAGTLHAIGAGLLLFEIQQTSDITYRLYDWDRIDPKTGLPRPLHIAEALECTDFQAGPVFPVLPMQETPNRERLFSCPFFRLWRIRSQGRFRLGAKGECRIVVALQGQAELQFERQTFLISRGSLLLLPAEVGACDCKPLGDMVVLEAAMGAVSDRGPESESSPRHTAR
ncbi:MAG TPA: type I phosphomannose isomerase catalytic subunit [Gemmataceae bacterium]|jgi:mannose-6-phosphate isomerase|nr:type I phosphomannose isomerase catalytic subunit [Gemmataceae bacterium]